MKRKAETKDTQLNVRVTKTQKALLERLSAETGMSGAEVLAEALKLYAGDVEGAAWMVWNPSRSMPSCTHKTKALAEAEAQRLARKVPGDTFVLMQSRHAFVVDKQPEPPVARVSFSLNHARRSRLLGDEIPF